MPSCGLTYACFEDCISSLSHGVSERTSEWWTDREDNLLRYLGLAEAHGFDLSGTVSHRQEEISIAQALAHGGWMGSVWWLAEERGIDVQHVTISRWACIGMTDEIKDRNKEILLRVQRAQRQRHAVRAMVA